jgi:threonine/homoserine/homoserine lactone efflux protein
MDQLSDLLASDPIYMAVAVVLSLIILFGAIKKLFKIVMVAGALLVLWIAYTTWSGEEVSIESAVDKATEAYEEGKESIEKAKDDFIDNIKEKKKID